MSRSISRATPRVLRAACLGLVLLAGCVKTGSVVEQQPLTTNIRQEKTAQVLVKAADPQWQEDAEQLRKGLTEEFKSRGWWQPAENASVIFEVTFVGFEKGDKAARMFVGAGEAELKTDVVVRTPDGKILARLAVTGNSKRQSTTTVGGFNTSWADSLPARAVRATIEQIIEYLESKKS